MYFNCFTFYLYYVFDDMMVVQSCWLYENCVEKHTKYNVFRLGEVDVEITGGLNNVETHACNMR
jgi:hypothetical protein